MISSWIYKQVCEDCPSKIRDNIDGDIKRRLNDLLLQFFRQINRWNFLLYLGVKILACTTSRRGSSRYSPFPLYSEKQCHHLPWRVNCYCVHILHETTGCPCLYKLGSISG